MKQWWVRHSDVDLGDYDPAEVEDITGCIPMLLDKCVVNNKIDLTVAELGDVYRKAARFVDGVRDATNPYRWTWYVPNLFDAQDMTDFSGIAPS